MPEAVSLCRHSYANYVIKSLLQYGTQAQQKQIIKTLVANLNKIGSGNYSCGVLNEALTTLESDEQLAFARALIQEPGLLVRMSKSRQGHFVAKAAIQILFEMGEPYELDTMKVEIVANKDVLNETRYG